MIEKESKSVEAEMNLQASVSGAAGKVEGNQVINNYFGTTSLQSGLDSEMELNVTKGAVNTRKNTIDVERKAFAIAGSIDNVDLPKLKAILGILKKMSGDTSIEIVDIESGSIRLILEGSQRGLEKLEKLFKSRELNEVLGISVEDVRFLETVEHPIKDIKTTDKKRLAFTIAGDITQADIAKLKAGLNEISDNEENTFDEVKWQEPQSRRVGHFSTLRTKITDAEILINSLSDLGISVRTNADVRGYNGQRVRADIVAVLEGDYDLGWSANNDGSFDLIANLWGVAKNHNQTELINSINQKYAVKKTLAEVKQRGLQNSLKKLVNSKKELVSVNFSNPTGDRHINPNTYYEQSGNHGIGHMSGGEIKGNAKVAAEINEADKQNLADAATEIQQLLEQLSETYPTSTNKEKMVVVGEAVEQIENNPTLKAKVINALKAGGTEAFKEAVNHPLVNILVATIEGWQDAE